MPRFQDQILDERLHPVPDAEIWVFYASGPNLDQQAALTDDLGQPFIQPLHSSPDGIFYYNAPDGVYENQIHYRNELRYIQQVLVGTATGTRTDGAHGDITVSNGGVDWQINPDTITGVELADNAVATANIADGAVTTPKLADDAVTFAKLANVGTGTVFYRKSAGAGDPETQPLATLKTDLGLTGNNTGDQVITLTGDVTGSGTGNINVQIAADAVGAAEIAAGAVGASELANGAIEAKLGFTPAADTVFTSVAKGLAPASGGGAVNYLRADGSWAAPPGTITSIVWGNITGTLSNQTDLQTALNGKAALIHTHVIADVTGLQAALDSKAGTALVSTSAPGLAPTRPGGTTAFLRADGTWAAPPGGGSGGGGLTDGDFGDVVVSGGGTAMTVESAAGNFTVGGRVSFSANGTWLAGGGSFYKDATYGLIMAAVTGSASDALFVTPTGASIWQVPVGTQNVHFYGAVNVDGAITSGGSALATVPQLANYLPLTGGTLSGTLRLGYDATTSIPLVLSATKELTIGGTYPDVIKRLNVNYNGEAGYGVTGLLLQNTYHGYNCVLQAVGANALYVTNQAGAPSAIVLGTWGNPADGSTFVASSGAWSISGGALNTKGAITSADPANANRYERVSVTAGGYARHESGDQCFGLEYDTNYGAGEHVFKIGGVAKFGITNTGAGVTGNLVVTGTVTSSGSTLATVSQLSNYLPLTGGTLSGSLLFGTAVSLSASGPNLLLDSDAFAFRSRNQANTYASLGAGGLSVTGNIDAQGGAHYFGPTAGAPLADCTITIRSTNFYSYLKFDSASGSGGAMVNQGSIWGTGLFRFNNFSFQDKTGGTGYATLDNTGLAVTGTISSTSHIKSGSGYYLRGDGNGVIVSVTGGDTNLYSVSTGAYNFLSPDNASYRVTFDGNNGIYTFRGGSSTNATLQTHPTGTGIYSIFKMLGAGASQPLGLAITAGQASASLDADTFIFRKADGTTILATLAATGLAVTGPITSGGAAVATVTPREQAVASAATVTPTFTNDIVIITAQTVGLTLANWSGTAVPNHGMVIRIKAAGVQTIGYGTNYRAIGVSLPGATVAGKTLYLGCIWNATDSKIDVVSMAQEA